jgi:hypothetical protein
LPHRAIGLGDPGVRQHKQEDKCKGVDGIAYYGWHSHVRIRREIRVNLVRGFATWFVTLAARACQVVSSN